MNTTEINGFEIDTFNQYDLNVGKREGICPLCSHTRQPKNQKAKCALQKGRQKSQVKAIIFLIS